MLKIKKEFTERKIISLFTEISNECQRISSFTDHSVERILFLILRRFMEFYHLCHKNSKNAVPDFNVTFTASDIRQSIASRTQKTFETMLEGRRNNGETLNGSNEFNSLVFDLYNKSCNEIHINMPSGIKTNDELDQYFNKFILIENNLVVPYSLKSEEIVLLESMIEDLKQMLKIRERLIKVEKYNKDKFQLVISP